MPVWSEHKALCEKRHAIAEEQRELVELAAKESRELTSEEEQKYQTLEKAYQETDRQVKTFDELKQRAELLADRQAHHKESGRELDDRGLPLDRDKHGRIVKDFVDQETPNEEARAIGFQAWLLRQFDQPVSERHVQAAEICQINIDSRGYKMALPTYNAPLGHPTLRDYHAGQARAMTVGVDTAGGYTVPEGFMREFEMAMLFFGGMRQVSFLWRTSTGEPIPWPGTNDTGNKGRLISEATAVSETALTVAARVFNSYAYTSDYVKISHQLIRDSAFQMVTIIGAALGERMSRIQNEHATTGDGASKPEGVTVGSALGVTAASASAVTDLEVSVDLVHSVDKAYRNGGSFQMNDSTIQAMKKLTDGLGRRLWQSSIAVGEPETLDGYPVIPNNDMPAIGTGNKSVVFGAMRKYVIREVGTFEVRRLTERFAEERVDALLGFMDWDSRLVDQGTNPVKHLIHP